MERVKRVVRLVEGVAVETVVLLYMVTSSFSSYPLKAFEESEACLVDLAIQPEICRKIVHEASRALHPEEYSKVEALLTDTEVRFKALASLAPVPALLFLGQFGDLTGRRRVAVLTPVAAELAAYLCLLAAEGLSLGAAGVALVRTLPGLSGGAPGLLAGAFGLIGESTSPEERTAKVGRLTVVVLAAQPVAFALSAFVYRPGVFYTVTLPSAVFVGTALLFGVFFLRDPAPRPYPDNLCTALFGPKNFYLPFMVLFKKRENNLRVVVLLLLSANILVNGHVQGESILFYQFLKRVFQLDTFNMNLLSTISVIVLFIGTYVAVNIFVERFHMKDYQLGILACLNKLFVNALYTVVKTVPLVYTATLLELFTGCTPIATRSFASKVVAPDELGKLFSVFGLSDLFFPPVFALLYGQVYKETAGKFEAAFFILSYTFIIPTIGVYIFTEKSMSQSSSPNPNQELSPSNESQQQGVINEAFTK